MAQSVPLLISGDEDSELSRFVVKDGSGLVTPWGDIRKLKEPVEFMVPNPFVLSPLGQNGFAYVGRDDRKVVLSTYLKNRVDVRILESSLMRGSLLNLKSTHAGD